MDNIKQTKDGGYTAEVNGQTLSIPSEGGNRHYQMVIKAIAEGITVEAYVEPVQTLAEERELMVCTPAQGILTLGETEWDRVLAYADTATWAEQVVIKSSQKWRRVSQDISFIGYLLGYTDEQMDSLFRSAKDV